MQYFFVISIQSEFYNRVNEKNIRNNIKNYNKHNNWYAKISVKIYFSTYKQFNFIFNKVK